MTINERVSDLIEKFTSDDMAALQRFVECCEDPDAGGHDVEKSTITRLSQYGALRQVRPGYHEVTEFGEFILNGGIDELQQYRAAAEPMYQAKFSLGWRDVTKEQYDDNAAHGAPVRIVYAAPQVTSDALIQFAEFMAAEAIKSGDYPDGWQCKASNAAHDYAQDFRATMLNGGKS
ncbi:hypothetical protein [Atlantibacter hermannii]|uniref:hypothetical protein n=1 Tax=Atlantibacter hermannii TaxID=565 RepID=UPI0028AE447F|nr:hypothetical protein [Atlantibacter hermannii]